RTDDFVVATFWLTVPPAWKMAAGRAVHLCQGYEGAYEGYAPIRGEIEAAYRLPLPKLVIGKSLISICEQFSKDVSYIGQIVDTDCFRTLTPPENQPLRVLLCGDWQIETKGIAEGYLAIAEARRRHHDLALVRASYFPPPKEEPSEAAQ